MNAFAVDVRVQPNIATGATADPNSVTLVTRLVCSKVTCRPTCGCTPLCITQSPLACW
ncbi:Uncharacterised protein [Chlamydia trachomatis]|nr:Uncharacterised protein [Chlamydia trachomatis]